MQASKLNAAGSALLNSTYLGGSVFDVGGGMAVDASGNAYVAGITSSSDFPTTPGAFQTIYGGEGDAFVSKLNAAATALLYSTYLGGSGADYGFGIAVDPSSNAYVTGQTASSNFPITPGAFQTTFGGVEDAFVTKTSFPAVPFLALKPSTLPFLVLRTVGTTSLSQTVKLTNVGSGQLNIKAISLTGADSGDFAQSNNCPATVAAGASCLITITFKPTAQGGAHSLGLDHRQRLRQPADRSALRPGHLPRVGAAEYVYGESAGRHLERRTHGYLDQRGHRSDRYLLHRD